MATKICTKCGIEKDVSEFYKKAKGRNGLWAQCKSCTIKEHKGRTDAKQLSDYNKEYRQKNSERLKVLNKKWREKNKNIISEKNKTKYENFKNIYSEKAKKRYVLNSEKIKLRVRNYREANKEKKYNQDRNYVLKNPDKVKKFAEKWRVNNPEKVKENAANQIKNLNRNYVRSKALRQGFTKDYIDENPEIILAKRELIKLKRLYKSKKT